ncbi:MAG: PD-(D/E)XK nuclease family protein [Gammaproteobacteria bacterium]|nr:PD-(D/E)XK nuclease family protein [Gammaproteobacteria bacterium]
MVRDNINLIPYADDPLAVLAQHLIADYSELLPDLTQAVVLMPEAHAAQHLRRLLLQQAEQSGQQAILCPQIISLRDWAKRQFNKYHKEPRSICGQHQRELILFDALSQHRSLLGSGSPWHLTDDLLKLFDQLTLNQKTLPTSYADFEKEIATAYGISADEFPALGHEANLVYTLWNAWHTQLNAEKVYDSETAYLLGLNADIENNTNKLYIAGYHQFSVAEQNWLKQLINKQRCQLYLHGQQRDNINPQQELTEYHPDTPITNLLDVFNIETNNEINNNYTRFINNCYQHEHHPFLQRTAAIASIPSEDICSQLKLLFCSAHEEQAHAVELQVRRWILDGKNNIGIVTENRRLARRVRALLERADVPLLDLAGWALSTTRAGAVLERWLECIEEDFSHLPLLDLLKSPFIFNELDPRQVKHATYRLEHDIIRHENVARTLHRYKKTIELRADKLQWSSDISALLLNILKTFESANEILKPLLKGKHNADEYIDALSTSLEILGMSPLFKEDAAGIRVIEMLDTLKHSATQYSLKFSWADFRTWLGRNLEQFVFSPEKNPGPVTLMGLAQSRLQKFDALIIASAEHEHLPGKTNLTPFFNNAVRMQLNLTTTHEILTERFHHFRRLLESAPEILITANNEENGEEVPLSPWLEIIQRFYQQTYSSSLEDTELKTLVNNPATFVIRSTDHSLPGKTTQARTILPKKLIPKSYSPSSYQKLMDCPYQFFAAHALNLAVSEEVQEALSKSDYGERVHKCLEAFHHDVNYLPGPFKNVVTEKNRDAAISILEEISQQVFSRDLDDSFEHSGWLSQWLKLIPGYIDWQIKNAEQWKFNRAELKSKISWGDNIELGGRLDRLDLNESGLSVIDYKTGIPASQSDIEHGEAVQLPFYALLAETELNKPVNRVSYLVLNKGVKYGAQLSGEALDSISQQIGDRLAAIIKEMEAEKVLTAWGDDKACRYCNMSRLCREQAWKN